MIVDLEYFAVTMAVVGSTIDSVTTAVRNVVQGVGLVRHSVVSIPMSSVGAFLPMIVSCLTFDALSHRFDSEVT